MGTLTADCPRLDAHCPHKLATSCRLTSTPNCCACADERPHSRLYRVYIDGVGYVQRGTRWQSYCWFCKEFWNNRLEATDPPLEASQTQIPHIPDQTEFLERWFEFYQGYRIVRQPNGTELRIAVIGEPFKEVSPGFLPRTLDQLRAGRQNDATRPENVFTRRRLTSEGERPVEIHQSIDEALDALLDDIIDADGVPDLDDDEEGEEAEETETPATDPPNAGMPNIAQRARDRMLRVFGTREDVQRDDYESPISAIFNRAEDRYRQAEERRASGETTDPRTSNMNNLTQQERRELEQQILWGVLHEPPPSFPQLHQTGNVRSYTPAPYNRRPDLSDLEISPSLSLRSSLDQITSDLNRLQAATDAVANARIDLARRRRRSQASEPVRTLDQPDRPPPLTDAQMTKKLDCQVCYSQLANIAVLPCGHMVMCQWCADIAVPVRHGHVPSRHSKCPMCRKTVKQRVKIHVVGDDAELKNPQASRSRTASMGAASADAVNDCLADNAPTESRGE